MYDAILSALGDDEGIPVEPRTDCPHVKDAVTPLPSKPHISIKTPCTSCQDTSENWVCVTCHDTFCSRFVQGHMQVHFDQVRHHIAVSYSDLSTWCYTCNDYIDDPAVDPIRSLLHKEKFGEPLPERKRNDQAGSSTLLVTMQEAGDAKGKGKGRAV
ncbi:uncharacterized protein SPPG_00154 [Spizellomyces punctatus DAOM BR117]|uniref:UBP-type domain-containing protein n=1 Tax=Spizellomyces punctatus (strain DAOM BR117) TaxID=645134 RepID=A0A0L0HU34_SPIPD|nr:uncharacterized protein SPPG_00154 [Spizellomyces punctatus DAOM BR117]KND04425.1 hypothetical protein SPPG_00154 [Spizellomyces punctatus DAOM BR117]|eukprot:XP_016612464.1 hypothetical protein SPPG_00154 [Spizellomyces punctatus DAOM BR117]